MVLVHLSIIFVQDICAHEKLPSFKSLRDAFVWEETRLETVLSNYEDIPNLALIKKVKKGGKKAGSRSKEEGRLGFF